MRTQFVTAFFAIMVTTAHAEEMPLSFEFAKDNPLKSRIYLNPLLSMVKINELASREVSFVKDNVTNKIEEETGEWYALVTNDEDPSPRYALLKNELCNEKDFRISWVDRQGKAHLNMTQRLGPSPQEWKPVAQIQVTSLKYDSKSIMAEFDYSIKQDNLQGVEKLSNFTPTIQLISCELLFEKPVSLPKIDIERKTITFDSSYADHKCLFTLHLSVLIYNKETECRDMMQTATNETSAKIALRCDQTTGYDCPLVNKQQSCKMTCDPIVVLSSDYHYGPVFPEPYVKVEWQLPTSNKSPIKSTIVRYSQIDVIFNNHPLGEFNATVVTISNDTGIELKPFSKSLETLYGVQICLIHDNNCAKEPNWELVPKHPVFVSSLVDALPPPVTTTTTTTTTTVTPAVTTPRKIANGVRGGAKKDNSTTVDKSSSKSVASGNFTDSPPIQPVVDNKKPEIDNLVAIATSHKPVSQTDEILSASLTTTKGASCIRCTIIWISFLVLFSSLKM